MLPRKYQMTFIWTILYAFLITHFCFFVKKEVLHKIYSSLLRLRVTQKALQ